MEIETIHRSEKARTRQQSKSEPEILSRKLGSYSRESSATAALVRSGTLPESFITCPERCH